MWIHLVAFHQFLAQICAHGEVYCIELQNGKKTHGLLILILCLHLKTKGQYMDPTIHMCHVNMEKFTNYTLKLCKHKL